MALVSLPIALGGCTQTTEVARPERETVAAPAAPPSVVLTTAPPPDAGAARVVDPVTQERLAHCRSMRVVPSWCRDP